MRVPRKPGRTRRAGYVSPREMPKGPNGRALCRYCHVEVRPPRLTFCSGQRATFRRGHSVQAGHGCVHEHCVRSNPGYARQCVFARDHGVCALCGLQSVYWEADHTIPVIEGGGECGLEGLRTLCSGCHKLETAALAARRAQRRKEDREE